MDQLGAVTTNGSEDCRVHVMQDTAHTASPSPCVI